MSEDSSTARMDEDRTTQSPSSPGTSLICEVCNKSFARPEHLRRHVSTSHAKNRRFACQQCSKDFVRRDALQRHLLTHQNLEPNLIQKGARACSSCSTAKARCSAEEPTCSRCQQREIVCVYPSVKRRMTAKTSPSNGSTDVVAEPVQEDQGQMQNIPQLQNMDSFDLPQFDPQYWNAAIPSINWLPLDFPDYTEVSPAFDNVVDPFAWAPPHHVSFDPSMVTQQPLVSQTNQLWTPQDPSPASLPPEPSPADSNKTRESEVGEFYVDGEPARLPRVKRRRISSRHQNVPSSSRSVASNGFSLAVPWSIPLEGHEDAVTPIHEDTYQNIVRTILYISQNSVESQPATPSSLFSENFRPELPAKRDIEYLLGLCVKNVLSLLPVVHWTRVHQLSWQTTLAMAAVGTNYVEQDTTHFTASVLELLRRVLYMAEEDVYWLPNDPTEVLQIKLFYCIGSIYSDSEKLQKHGAKMLHGLVQDLSRNTIPSPTDHQQSHWQSFVSEQTLTRTWHAIWLLDTQYAYQHQTTPTVSMTHNMPPLPCPQDSWIAQTSEEWSRLPATTTNNSTILSVLETLYTTKGLPPSLQLCEYSRILLIHGIFHRTWSVAAYYSQPLSQWTPTATRSSATDLQTTQQIWLPAHDIFAKWRNSACDCLDVLHWAANATIGENKGLEHPTVLHLHVARVILLTPYESIVRLAKHLAGDMPMLSETDLAKDKQAIRRWVTQDQYKARLAMIHAGVMFWHIRRFGTGAWHEGDATALCILTLWAFSAFSSSATNTHHQASTRSTAKQPTTTIASTSHRTTNNNPSTQNPSTTNAATQPRTRSSSPSTSSEPLSPLILLDRPTDDELVQQFVRRGDEMKAHMNGVGDLYAKGAAEKVLIEGRRVLRGLGGRWGGSREGVKVGWGGVLDGLIERGKGRIGGVHGGGGGGGGGTGGRAGSAGMGQSLVRRDPKLGE